MSRPTKVKARSDLNAKLLIFTGHKLKDSVEARLTKVMRINQGQAEVRPECKEVALSNLLCFQRH